MQKQSCPVCFTYLLDHTDPKLKGWKTCKSCGYAHDKDGYNRLNPKKSVKMSHMSYCPNGLHIWLQLETELGIFLNHKLRDRLTVLIDNMLDCEVSGKPGHTLDDAIRKDIRSKK